MIYPFIRDWDDTNSKKVKYQERRQRIFMRGIKIGAKKGGGANQGMQVFEMKEKKDFTTPGSAQKASEGEAKSQMSDESLGLSSE